MPQDAQDARILDFTAFAQGTGKPSKPAKQPTKTKARHKSGLFRRHFRYKDPITGEVRQKDVYGATDLEAEKNKKAFLRKVEQGLRVNENGRTLSQWADEWLMIYKAGKVKQKTFQSYAGDVKRIKAHFSQRPLSAVMQRDIVEFLETRKGMSASAIRKTAMTINAVMDAAVANRLIPFNPCVGVSPPKGTSGTHRALTQEEIAAVVKTAEAGHYFARPVMLMLFAGLRRGEVAALTANDIVDGHITVSKAVEWPDNKGAVSTPKSTAGTRSVPIFTPLWPYTVGLPDGYIVTGARPNRKQHISLQAFRIGFHSFLSACKSSMPNISFRCHDLRHTFATMIYDAGVDVKTAQLWLGHADPAVTMRIYTHLSEGRKADAMKAANQYFSSGGTFGGI